MSPYRAVPRRHLATSPFAVPDPAPVWIPGRNQVGLGGTFDGGAWRDPFAATDPVTYQAEFLPPGSTGRRIDYLLLGADPARFPVIDSGLLFTEPLALPDGRRMYLSDHVALTTRIALR